MIKTSTLLLFLISFLCSCSYPNRSCLEFEQCLQEDGEQKMFDLLYNLGKELDKSYPKARSKETILQIIKDAQNGLEILVAPDLLAEFNSVPTSTFLPQCTVCTEEILMSNACPDINASMRHFEQGLHLLRIKNDFSHEWLKGFTEKIANDDFDNFLPFYYFIIYLSVRN